MIVNGITIPDEAHHFASQIRANPEYQGAGTYRFSKLIRAMGECTDQHRIAIDVGAHFGMWSRVLSYHFKHVVAFEPFGEFIPYLQTNTKQELNVEVRQKALGYRNGYLFMTQAQDGEGTASIDAKGLSRVHVNRLDDEAIYEIDFIKISCEGAEQYVLEGGEHVLRRDKPVVLIEQKRKRLGRYGFQENAGVKLLERCGATVLWTEQGDWCLSWKASPLQHSIPEQNTLTDISHSSKLRESRSKSRTRALVTSS